MKKFLAAFVTICVVAVPSYGDPELNVSVFSRHAWRGQSGPDTVSIQPEVTISIGEAGTAVSVWGQVPTSGSSTEIDVSISQDVKGIGTLYATSYYYDGAVFDVDSHDIEIAASVTYNDISLFVARFIAGDAVKDDTWIQLGYSLGGIDLFAGVGDGSYIEGGSGFGLVMVGGSFSTDGGYGATFFVNPDSETPMFIVSKSW